MSSVLFFSFTRPDGGEGFEVYVGNKLVLQQFGSDMNTVKTIPVSQAQSGEKITVKYYHCGQPGKNRTLTVKNQQNKIVKQWKYADAAQANAGMSCPVSDLIDLQKNGNEMLCMYYSSSELKAEKKLAIIASASALAKK